MNRTYRVWGLVCGVCLGAVVERVRALREVNAVAMDLVKGGGSPLRINTTAAPSLDELRRAVRTAGSGFALTTGDRFVTNVEV
jgi:hypothetical protein